MGGTMRRVRFLTFGWIILFLTHSAAADEFGQEDWRWRGQPEATEASEALAVNGAAWMQMVAWQASASGGGDVAAASKATGDEGDVVQGRWSDFLPLWGKSLREEGYSLPLPFGVSLVGAGVWQDTLQNEIRLSFDPDAPPIDTGLVDLSTADTNDGSIGVRLDAFILPFFSIYAMGGFNTGEAKFDITIAPIPIIVPEGAKFRQEEDYIGGWVGGGGTVALGWKQLFWMADGNGTWSKTDAANSTIVAATFSTRAGWRGEFENSALSLWVGTMYLHYTQTVKTSVDIIGLDIEVEVEGADPWNMLLGGQFELGKSWSLMLEGGFIGRKQVVGMATFRF
jgi:hypothetical protein